jgi:serine protease Do
VIGINVAIRQGAQRIGFAIPIDDVRKVVAQLMSVEQLDRTYHGMNGRDLKSGTQRMLIVENTQTDSPAAKAGLKAGDVVLKVGEKDVVDSVDWERSLLGKTAGTSVPITVRRGDKTETVQLALAPLTTGRTKVAAEIPYVARANNDSVDAERFWKVLGLKLAAVPHDRAATIPSKYHGGLLVTDVKAQSSAAANGIRKDDILVGLRDFETLSYDNINWILNQPIQPGQENLKYYVIRGQQTLWGNIQLLAADQKASTVR